MAIQKANEIRAGTGYVQAAAQARQTEENPALKAALAWMMVKHLLEGIRQQVSPGEAGNIARESGRMAGEDFLFQYLDLQDPPKIFYQKLMKKSNCTGFPLWDIDSGVGGKHGQIIVRFAGIRGCRGNGCKKQPLHCEFMKGYLAGILECYTGGSCCVDTNCGAMADRELSVPYRCCSFTVVLENSADVAGWV